MEETQKLVLIIAVLIGAAKLTGYLSNRLGQPAVLGELLVGVILGPSLLNVLSWGYFHQAHLETPIQQLAEIGVILLMFVAGLEIDLDDLLRAGKASSIAGVLGVIVPLVLGMAAGLLFGYPWLQALFIGILLTATSVSISAQTLLELGVLRTRPGITLLGAAVIDDVLVILILSLYLALAGGGGGGGQVLLVVTQMGLYLTGAVVLGRWLVPRLARWVAGLRISQGMTALAVVVTLLLSWSAEALGHVAMITGAFIAGILFSRTEFKQRVEQGVRPLTYGFFVPIFFTSIGFQANIRELGGQLFVFAALIVAIAIVSKIIGCGLGGLVSGLPRREAFQLGLGMVSRGEVGLIVATVGITQGVIGPEIYAIAVAMVLVTTLLTPLLLRWGFAGQTANVRQPEQAPSARA